MEAPGEEPTSTRSKQHFLHHTLELNCNNAELPILHYFEIHVFPKYRFYKTKT